MAPKRLEMSGSEGPEGDVDEALKRQSWCKNSKTLFHCSTRNTSAPVLFHLWNSWSRQLFHTLSDVTNYRRHARLFATLQNYLLLAK
jgi:hypothetical protein